MRTLAEVLDQFRYHPATPDTARSHDELRQACTGLAKRLWALIPDGPEKTLALRKLQEAAMYGNLAIALSAPAAEPGTEAVPRTLPARVDLSTVPEAELVAEYNARIKSQPRIKTQVKAEPPADDTPPTLTKAERDAFTKGGQCFGVTSIETIPNEPGWLRGICYYGLCTWAKRFPTGTEDMDTLKRAHHTAQAPLTEDAG